MQDESSVQCNRLYEEPDLRDYAMIGDCRTGALISRRGSVDWLCLPDFSSPSIFAKILDNTNGGCFSILLEGMDRSSRSYIEDTPVLETTLASPGGSIRITDCMPVSPSGLNSSLLTPERELLRKVEVITGSPVLEIRLDARPDYAKTQGTFHNRGKLGWTLCRQNHLLNLITDFPVERHDHALKGRKKVIQGDIFWFSLTFESTRPGILLPMGTEAETRIAATQDWWRKWCEQCNYTGIWRDNVVRSAITLRMLTFTPSGALLAALTTSLPEKPAGWMNWDYRFCWPRDAALTLTAFIDIGFKDEADAFFGWLMLAANATRPRINSIYDIYGRHHLKESLRELAGFGNAQPVRIGNEASEQVQHDVYGEVMLAVEDWIRHFRKPNGSERKLIEGFGRAVAATWRNPDYGIWEIRDKPRHYTYSKAMAWHVFNSLIRLHEQGCIAVPVERYRKERDELRELIETKGYDKKRNCFLGVIGEDTLDASLLLLPHCGFIAYEDARMRGTWDAILENLEHNGLILRYPPGFANSQPGEGALLVCNFWAVDYLAGCGLHAEAKKRLERLMSFSNDVGLFNEAVDTDSLKALGNVPQAFSHAGFIRSVIKLHSAVQLKQKAT